MKITDLKKKLQNPYNRSKWISLLHFISGKKDLFVPKLLPIIDEFSTKSANKIIDQFHQIGSIKTSDNILLPVYEVILNKNIKIEHNRVAVNEFIKKHIIKDAIKGALVTFSYANVETEEDLLIFNADSSSKSEWRFSFISKNAANDFFAEAIGKETNPKKFTYIFGNNEAHRTAIERLYNLEQSRFRLDDFFEAFNIEPVSKKFFDEYKLIYKELASYIYEIEEYKKVFTKISSDDEGTKREIRSFVGRLMGRIVFLYFLQKKNWLGASNPNFTDGSTSFLSDIFKNDDENQNDFYTKYLCPIFFEALNTNRGNSQEFTLINGVTVCIPFLNGGLFEEEQEPSGHRNIKFRKSDFNRIFDFFNSYNFTVYENSPEEHTIAVDPEMLGHIFENLIDYNKDTGTFYTPKEIVQYMTQESLIEYVYTNTNINRLDLELLVKNQFADNISNDEFKIIDKLLDSVKICDPAIGSGAFPVGMLQEIFNLKALINYRLKDKEWNPADIKQNIIQNSIYGVDIDSGAVEIARLRFWLSLVIDEGLPKPLPNLDFKIVVGNSLTSKFDLNVNINSVFNDFNNKISNHEIDDSEILDIIDGDTIDVDFYKKIVNEYLVESDHKKKLAFKKLISAIKESFRSTLNSNKLFEISRARGYLFNLNQKDIFGNIKGSKEEISQAKNYLLKLENERKNVLNDRIHQDALEWRFEFPQLLDNEANFKGFDIVIGNPPYVDIKGLDKELVKFLFSKYETTVNRINLYSVFLEQSKKLLKSDGILSFIIPNSLLINDSYKNIRGFIIDDLLQIIKLPDSIFNNAIVETIIVVLGNNTNTLEVNHAYFKNNEKINLNNIKFNKIYKQIWKEDYFFKFNIFQDQNETEILRKIRSNTEVLENLVRFSLGITPYDNAKGHSKIDIKNKIFHSKEKLSDEYVPLIKGKNIKRFYVDFNSDEYLKYGNWLGAPRDEVFFINPKIIVRQILDSKHLKIISSYTEEKTYFTQIGFSIIKRTDIQLDLRYILALLNSKLISFYHKYEFLDTEKIIFPKILIANCKKFPIKIINEENQCLFRLIVLFLETIYSVKQDNNLDNVGKFFENILDALVFDLYFTEEMILNNIYITNLIMESIDQNLFEHFENIDLELKISLLLKYYKEWSLGYIQIRMSDYIIKSPNLLKIILQG